MVLCVYSASRVLWEVCSVKIWNSVQQEQVEEVHVFFSSIGLRDFIGMYLRRVLLLLLLPFEDFGRFWSQNCCVCRGANEAEM